MIVSGVHLGDKKTAHVLLSYRIQQPQHSPTPPLPTPPLSTPPPRRPSRLTQEGLRSSLQSADSGGRVLNASPLLVLQGFGCDLASALRAGVGGGCVGGG